MHGYSTDSRSRGEFMNYVIVGHKSHDPVSMYFLRETGVITFVALCTTS